MLETAWALPAKKACKNDGDDHRQEAGQTFCRCTVSQANKMVSEVLYTLLPSRAESGGSVQPSMPDRLRKLFSVTLVSTNVLMNCSMAVHLVRALPQSGEAWRHASMKGSADSPVSAQWRSDEVQPDKKFL